jgi:alkylated DNA repair dioxygenase AlkB
MTIAPVMYLAGFLAGPVATELFDELRANLAWERRDDAPRYEYHCNDRGLPYAYGRGRGRRTYEARPYTPEILLIRAAVEYATGHEYGVCFLNRYEGQHDHLGWHADDSPEMDDTRPIVSVSLGAARPIQFRRKVPRGPRGAVARPEEEHAAAYRAEVWLEHGSALVMAPGMQDTWEHRIPKRDRVVGERISLVFRGWAEPEHTTIGPGGSV